MKAHARHVVVAWKAITTTGVKLKSKAHCSTTETVIAETWLKDVGLPVDVCCRLCLLRGCKEPGKGGFIKR